MRLRGGMFARNRGAPSRPPRRQGMHRLEAEAAKFKRSATITGSLSDDIKASAETRGQLLSPRLEAQVKRSQRRKFGRHLVLAASVVVVLLLVWANRITSYQVVFVDGITTNPPMQPYIATAQMFRSTKIANRFAPTLHTNQLASYLMQTHEEIAGVQVRTGLFRRQPQLVVAMRRPVLSWHTRQEKQAFYVDALGAPFMLNAFGNDKDLVKVNDESGVPAELGAPVASSRQIRFLGQLVGQVAASSGGKLRVSRIVFPPSSTKEVHVFLEGRNYYIRAYLERPARAQGEAIAKTVAALAAKGHPPAEYVDVRSAGKVFYK